jgi:hypothetical protein
MGVGATVAATGSRSTAQRAMRKKRWRGEFIVEDSLRGEAYSVVGMMTYGEFADLLSQTNEHCVSARLQAVIVRLIRNIHFACPDTLSGVAGYTLDNYQWTTTASPRQATAQTQKDIYRRRNTH